MISKMYPNELSRLRHRALVFIAYALLLQTLTVVDLASSDAPAASKQNLETLRTTQPQAPVDIKNEFDGSNLETLREQSGDIFADANSEFDDEYDDDDDDDEEIFRDALEGFEDEPTDGVLQGSAKHQPGILSRLGDSTKSLFAPAREYYNLVVRLQKWRNEYNRLQVTYGTKPDGEPKLRNSLDIMRLEYAQVDRMLVDEMCRDGGGGDDKPAYYQMDFIWKVLKLLIGRLEAKLDELKRAGPNDSSLAGDYDEETLETLRQIEANASDRAKSIIARSAAQLAKREFIRVVDVYMCDMIATYIINSHTVDANGVTTLMGQIQPFVFLVGRANSMLLVSYLKNVMAMPVLKLFQHYYTTLSCPLEQATESPERSALVSTTPKPIEGH